ncbi:MAG: DUF599 domain-containing protein [Paracoccaceae bacterium]
MDWAQHLTLFTPLDATALALLVAAWLGIGWRIERTGPGWRPSVSVLMADYRREWMRQMVAREPRIFDAQIVSSLRQSTAFFASTAVIAVGGVLATLGNVERLSGVATELTLETDPRIVLEIKLLALLVLLIDGFLKFVWSNRLFGYCSVLMAAVPNDPDDPMALPRAAKAAELNITAARSYNRGLRSLYFALASGAWLLGAWALIGAALITLVVLWRREFASKSRAMLLRPDDRSDTRI